MPALFTRMFKPPKRLAVASMERRTSSARPTSHSIARASPPVVWICWAMRRPCSTRRPTIATRAPSWAKRMAAASPMPEVAPLIQATCPSSRRVFILHAVSPPLLPKAGPLEDLGVDRAFGLPAQRKVHHALADHPADVAEELVGPGDAVGRQEDVVQLAEAVRRRDRLLGETID